MWLDWRVFVAILAFCRLLNRLEGYSTTYGETVDSGPCVVGQLCNISQGKQLHKRQTSTLPFDTAPSSMAQLHAVEPNPAGNLVSFYGWINELNRTRATGHRWRREYPWLKVVNIFGKLYISRDTIAEFERRALAGELAKEIRVR
jgi:hypothetical protein